MGQMQHDIVLTWSWIERRLLQQLSDVPAAQQVFLERAEMKVTKVCVWVCACVGAPSDPDSPVQWGTVPTCQFMGTQETANTFTKAVSQQRM